MSLKSRFFGVKLCDTDSRIQGNKMRSEEETMLLERRVTFANEHWRLFLSEMPLREKNLHSVSQALNTKVEASQEITDTKKMNIK